MGYEALEGIFEKLDWWRRLPNYQMERRIDIFFGYYLKRIVESHLTSQNQRIELHDIIIPEFPVRKSLVGEGDTNHSFKVDYVLFSQQPGKVIFLELKTDMASIDQSQKDYLNRVSQEYFNRVLHEIKKIFIAGNRLKYLYLLECLEQVGRVKLPLNLRNTIESWGRAKSLIEKIEIASLNEDICVFYIQPMNYKSENVNVISFAEISKYLRSQDDDPLTKLFARYLDKWGTPLGQ